MELVIETPKFMQLILKLFLRQDQSRNAEVVSPWRLLEATPWNKGDACVLQDFKTVE